MCLRAQGIDKDNGNIGRRKRSQGISGDDGGVGRGQGIDESSGGLETKTEAAGDRRWAQGIYDNDVGVGG